MSVAQPRPYPKDRHRLADVDIQRPDPVQCIAAVVNDAACELRVRVGIASRMTSTVGAVQMNPA
jgi:hypothetical protein